MAVNGAVARPAHKLRAGDEIVLTLAPPKPVGLVAQDIPLTVLHEDADLIAIDKPAGLVVHPAAGHADGTLVNALLHHIKDLRGVGGELRPGIVHRLDKDTSGVLVVAKHEVALAALQQLFKDKDEAKIQRVYQAIVVPAPKTDGGTIATFYGRHPADTKRFTSKLAAGKRAVTHWRMIERLAGGAAALVECKLQTGRTHQIRVHMADSGWPILGDTLYARKPKDGAVTAIATRGALRSWGARARGRRRAAPADRAGWRSP